MKDCPVCDRTRTDATFRGLIGWLVAFAFFALWLTDANLGRFIGALLIEWVG